MRQLALLTVLPMNLQTSSGNPMETQPVQPAKVGLQKPSTLHNLLYYALPLLPAAMAHGQGLERVQQPPPAQSASVAFAVPVHRAD